jgi:hypothetical protein
MNATPPKFPKLTNIQAKAVQTSAKSYAVTGPRDRTTRVLECAPQTSGALVKKGLAEKHRLYGRRVGTYVLTELGLAVHETLNAMENTKREAIATRLRALADRLSDIVTPWGMDGDETFTTILGLQDIGDATGDLSQKVMRLSEHAERVYGDRTPAIAPPVVG